MEGEFIGMAINVQDEKCVTGKGGREMAQAGKRSSQEVTQASLLQGTTGLSLPGRSGCQSV